MADEEIVISPEEVLVNVEEDVDAADHEEEITVTIGDAEPPKNDLNDLEFVRDLRKKQRDDLKRIRELEDQLKATNVETKSTLGAKPTLEGLEYDTEAYDTQLIAWYDQKRKHDEQAAHAAAQVEAANKTWQDQLASYGKAKTELKVSDYEDAEEVAQSVLSQTQQGIIIQGADEPALVIYAIGKNPAKAKKLAAITDPIRYAFAISKLETQLKITKRNAPPPPEQRVRGGGAGISGTVDSTLTRLRADAEKTGDYSKVSQYNRSKRQK